MPTFSGIPRVTLTVAHPDVSVPFYESVLVTVPGTTMSDRPSTRQALALPGGQGLPVTAARSRSADRCDATAPGLDQVRLSYADRDQVVAWAEHLDAVSVEQCGVRDAEDGSALSVTDPDRNASDLSSAHEEMTTNRTARLSAARLAGLANAVQPGIAALSLKPLTGGLCPFRSLQRAGVALGKRYRSAARGGEPGVGAVDVRLVAAATHTDRADDLAAGADGQTAEQGEAGGEETLRPCAVGGPLREGRGGGVEGQCGLRLTRGEGDAGRLLPAVDGGHGAVLDLLIAPESPAAGRGISRHPARMSTMT